MRQSIGDDFLHQSQRNGSATHVDTVNKRATPNRIIKLVLLSTLKLPHMNLCRPARESLTRFPGLWL